jgi:hypothetical protein
MPERTSSSKERVAQCLCGLLRVSALGDPLISYLCHCTTCQRRSGAPVHFGTYFAKSNVSYSGPSKIYTRVADSGFSVHHHFCPDCGSTVYLRRCCGARRCRKRARPYARC